MWVYLIFLLGCTGSTIARGTSTHHLLTRGGASPAEVETNEAFAEIGQYLLRIASKERSEKKAAKRKSKRKQVKEGTDSAWTPYEERHILRALNKLSAGQSALKSMDGATHRLRNAFSDKGSSLEARFEAFLDSDNAGNSKKGRKEAGKVYEYVSAVERFFQGSEVLQAAVEANEDQQKDWFQDAGLEEVARFKLSANKVNVIMYVLKPINGGRDEGDAGAGAETLDASGGKKSQKDTDKLNKTRPLKFEEDETVLAFVESASDSRVSLAQVLRVMGEEPLSMPLTSVGFVQEEVSLQPTFVEAANMAMEKLSDVLKSSTPPPPELPTVKDGDAGSEEDIMEKGGDDSGDSEGAGTEATTAIDGDDIVQPVQPTYEGKVRIFGYSAGAAVGAYVGMILEGTLDTEDSRVNPVPALNGAFKDRMKAVLVAPPPCISRSIVSQSIISLLCGDDVVPRAAPDAIMRLRRRVLKALQSGAGKGGFSGLGYTASAGFLKDLKAVTGKSVKTYTSGEHDLSSLRVPGRVFYLKARSHKQGASLQRVMRGNWREDMLWQLNEVLLSDRMLRHHELDYHIKTLDRL